MDAVTASERLAEFAQLAEAEGKILLVAPSVIRAWFPQRPASTSKDASPVPDFAPALALKD